MISAQVAWELQEATNGNFRLGLGTQVRTHIVRRYGGDFERPGPRLRDYVLAVKACFAGFRGDRLDHHGEFYELTFLNAQWSPGAIDLPDPLVDIAAVNPWMLTMAGEVADGVHVHPIAEPGYIDRHVIPSVAAGAAKTGRSPDEIALIVPVTTIVGDSDEEIARDRAAARQMLSFYGSTPNYAFIWDEAGFEGTTARIREKQKANDFAGMAAEITDDHLARSAPRPIGMASLTRSRKSTQQRPNGSCSTTLVTRHLNASKSTALSHSSSLPRPGDERSVGSQLR